jgi:hypothetical protein
MIATISATVTAASKMFMADQVPAAGLFDVRKEIIQMTGWSRFSAERVLLSRHSGARSCASPETILPVVVMDSGPAPSGASRNDKL